MQMKKRNLYIVFVKREFERITQGPLYNLWSDVGKMKETRVTIRLEKHTRTRGYTRVRASRCIWVGLGLKFNPTNQKTITVQCVFPMQNLGDSII